MTPTRRLLLLSPALLLTPSLLRAQGASGPLPAAADPHRAEHGLGRDDAPVRVTEWYSLTCSHCARFSAGVFPQIQKELIDTGKLRYVFADYPLDKPALLAAQILRYAAPDRYEPLSALLLSTQRRWAFGQGVNPKDEIAKIVALAGLSRAQVDAAAADTALRDAILTEQDDAKSRLSVDSTPTFIFNGPKAHDRAEAGELSFAEFAAIVNEVAGA